MKSQGPEEPRSLKKPETREDRLSHKEDNHVFELNKFVDELRKNQEHSKDLPYFDPMDGGSEAQCLFLFEAPGGKAVASGFASRDNNDQSAENFFRMNRDAELNRKLTVSWNVTPWALRETGKNRTPKDIEIAEAVEQYLHRVLDIVNPKVVVLFENSAHKAEEMVTSWSNQICLIKTNHPSPRNVNSRKEMWGKITAALVRAKSCISEAKE